MLKSPTQKTAISDISMEQTTEDMDSTPINDFTDTLMQEAVSPTEPLIFSNQLIGIIGFPEDLEQGLCAIAEHAPLKNVSIRPSSVTTCTYQVMYLRLIAGLNMLIVLKDLLL